MLRIVVILCLLFCTNEVFSYRLVVKGDFIVVLDDFGCEKYFYNKHVCRVILRKGGKSFYVERFEKQKVDDVLPKKYPVKRKIDEISVEDRPSAGQEIDFLTPPLDQIADQDDFISEEDLALLEQIEQDYAINTKIDHIVGPVAHHETLVNTIVEAKKNLLITSDSITFLPKDIYRVLKDAAIRGVKIYIYVNRAIDERVLDFLESISTIQQRNIHAKYLVADDHCVIIGSHNWFDFDYSNGENRSFKISKNKEYVVGIKEQIWGQIRYYGNVQHCNIKDIQKTQKSIYRSAILEYPLTLKGDSKLSFLSSLDAHEIFLKNMCQKAEHRIQIYSPFVTFNNACTRLTEVVEVLKPGVMIDIFIWQSQQADQLFGFIQRSPYLSNHINVHVLDSNIHSKTLIMDDSVICEGSFNWLSSSLREDSIGHNLDSSVVCEGTIARNILKDF